MVKTHMGRKPGKAHARIIKKLRYKRRLLAMQKNQEKNQVEIQKPENLVKVEGSKIQQMPDPVKKVVSVVCQPVEVVAEPVKCAVVVQIAQKNCVETIQEKMPEKVVHEKREELQICRSHSASDLKPFQPEIKVTSSVSVNVGAKKVETDAVKKSELKSKDDREQPQKTDEETDRYLCGLFTPSVETLTENLNSHNTGTAPRRCSNCHCLLLKSETMSKLRNLFSDPDATLNNISRISESSLGLRTLFAETLPVSEADAVSTYGLRTLFNELKVINSTTETDGSTYGLRNLFHVSEDEVTLKTIEPTNNTTSFGLRTPFEPKRSKSETSNLLDNLFVSETTVNESVEISDKERKKVMIAKDLAHYLNSDDERSAPKSQSLTTFVRQIENLFDRYRAALAVIDKLEDEVAMLKSRKN